MLPYQTAQLVLRKLARAKGAYLHTDGLCHADGISQRHFAFVRQTGRHQILSHIPGGVAGGAVHLGRVFAAERAAAVAGIAAVGVHDDLAPGQTRVARGAAQHKAAGRVDVYLGVLLPEVLGNDLVNDLGENAVFQLPAADLLVMLGGNDHRVHGHGLAVLIFYRHLTFAVGSEPRQRSILPYLGQAAGQPVGQRDRQGHQFWGLVTGIAEHHALIASTVGSFARLSAGFQRVVHAHGDIGTLGMNGGQYGAAVAVEAKIAAGVANVPDHLPGNFVDGNIGGSGDLAHHLHQAGGGAGLTGHAGHGVFGEDSVQHRVADLVAKLVRVSFSDGFTGENGTHENDLLRFCGCKE